MKVLILGHWPHYEQYLPPLPITKEAEVVYVRRNSPDAEAAALCPGR